MTEFVRQHSFEFLVIQQVKDSLRDSDGCVRRIASSGEGIGRLGRNNIDFWHRQPDFLDEPLNNLVGAWKLFARDWLGAVHGQRQFVGEEVGDEVQYCGKNQCEQHSVLTAEHSADEHQQQGKCCQQECCFECVSHK